MDASSGPMSHSLTWRECKFRERFRKTREDFCLKTFNSGELAAAGLCMMPALLLNPNTKTRIIQFLYFFFLVWLFGKKTKLPLTFSVMLGIILFNLLVPYGQILFSLGPLAVTDGALMGGIRRAVTLEGLFMLSRCCVRQDLVLSGSFGELIGESFRIFSRLAEEKIFFTKQNWLENMDLLLISCQRNHDNETARKTGAKNRRPPDRTIGSRIILLAMIILAWLPLKFSGN
jgi:heptaprenyl diphosphate synthase